MVDNFFFPRRKEKVDDSSCWLVARRNSLLLPKKKLFDSRCWPLSSRRLFYGPRRLIIHSPEVLVRDCFYFISFSFFLSFPSSFLFIHFVYMPNASKRGKERRRHHCSRHCGWIFIFFYFFSRLVSHFLARLTMIRFLCAEPSRCVGSIVVPLVPLVQSNAIHAAANWMARIKRGEKTLQEEENAPVRQQEEIIRIGKKARFNPAYQIFTPPNLLFLQIYIITYFSGGEEKGKDIFFLL